MRSLALSFLVGSFLLFSNSICAQWRYAVCTQQTGDLKKVNQYRGYGIKVNTLVRTLNGGSTWRSLNVKPENTSSRILDFTMLQSGVGYLINDDGELIKTIDSGDTWVRVANLGGNLARIQFVNDTLGFVNTVDGRFFKTTDGGFSWAKKNIGVIGASTYDMQFDDESNGWIIGGGILYKTVNGGETWTQQTRSGSLMQFIGNSGWIFTPNSMFKTTNGGLSWDSTWLGTTQVKKIQFVSTTNGWRLTNLGFELTLNGGVTWSAGSGSPLQRPFESFSFSDATEGIAIDDRSNYYITSDGGATWQLTNYSKALGSSTNTYDVFMANTTTAFMVNNDGGCMRTTNKGLTWLPVTTGQLSLLVAVHFSSDAKSGAIVGQNGVINTTIDSGITWTYRNLGSTTLYYDVIYANQAYFAIGANGTIRRGIHTQASWPTISSGTTQALRSISFPSSQIGYIVGHGGIILKTGDGGSTWQSQSSGTTQALIKVVFRSDTEGMAVGLNGTVLYTSNGGTTWVSLPSNTTEHFLSLAYNGNNQWWITGNNGGIYLKQGANPVKFLQQLAFNPLNGIDFFDPNNGIIVANTGFVLEYKLNCSGNIPISYNNPKNALICTGDSTILFAAGQGKIKWYESSGAVNPIAEGTQFQTPSLTNPIVYYVEDSSCQVSTRSPIQVTVQSTIPTITTENFFTSCEEGSVNLSALTNGEKLNWYDQTGNMIAQGALFTTSSLSYGQYQYGVQAVLGACKSNIEPITVNVEEIPQILTINNDSVCESGVLTLSISKNFGTPYWYGDPNYNVFIGQGFDTLVTPILSQTQTYYVEVSGSRCVSPMEAVVAKVNAYPNTTVTAGVNKLTATQDSATYKWLDCDADLSWITTETAKYFSPSNTGNYAVEINLKGCIDTSTCTNIIIDRTGEAELNSEYIQLYPNPAQASLHLTMKTVQSNAELILVDATGKVVVKRQIDNSDVNVDLQGLPSGNYILRVIGNDINFSRKVSIQR